MLVMRIGHGTRRLLLAGYDCLRASAAAFGLQVRNTTLSQRKATNRKNETVLPGEVRATAHAQGPPAPQAPDVQRAAKPCM